MDFFLRGGFEEIRRKNKARLAVKVLSNLLHHVL
jgi:hypothetical protein